MNIIFRDEGKIELYTKFKNVYICIFRDEGLPPVFEEEEEGMEETRYDLGEVKKKRRRLIDSKLNTFTSFIRNSLMKFENYLYFIVRSDKKNYRIFIVVSPLI